MTASIRTCLNLKLLETLHWDCSFRRFRGMLHSINTLIEDDSALYQSAWGEKYEDVGMSKQSARWPQHRVDIWVLTDEHGWTYGSILLNTGWVLTGEHIVDMWVLGETHRMDVWRMFNNMRICKYIPFRPKHNASGIDQILVFTNEQRVHMWVNWCTQGGQVGAYWWTQDGHGGLYL